MSTTYRIDLPHLCWALENLAAGTPVNVIRVDDATARDALAALNECSTSPPRMPVSSTSIWNVNRRTPGHDRAGLFQPGAGDGQRSCFQ